MIKELYTTADEVFRLTSQLNMIGQPDYAEKEIDSYMSLLDKREPLIQRMSMVKQAIDSVTSDSAANAIMEQKELRLAEEKVAAILALDRRHAEIVINIMDTLKSSMKSIRNEKVLRNVYTHPMENLLSGVLDAKQ